MVYVKLRYEQRCRKRGLWIPLLQSIVFPVTFELEQDQAVWDCFSCTEISASLSILDFFKPVYKWYFMFFWGERLKDMSLLTLGDTNHFFSYFNRMLSRKWTSQGKPQVLPATSLWSHCGWWTGEENIGKYYKVISAITTCRVHLLFLMKTLWFMDYRVSIKRQECIAEQTVSTIEYGLVGCVYY